MTFIKKKNLALQYIYIHDLILFLRNKTFNFNASLMKWLQSALTNYIIS